jgi:predicted dehydrogenase
MSKLRVAILGCGQISKIYLKNLTGMFAGEVDVVAVGDVVEAAAKTRAEEYKIARVGSPDELIADPKIDLLLNLTPAPVHYGLTRKMLAAGKHVYSEKPLALSMTEGRDLVALARSKGLMLSVAPDTILGAGVQTCRKVIESGDLGTVVAGFGFVSIPKAGERYMTVFRGPLLDLGPYHVGALLTMLGPVKSVSGQAHAKRETPGEPLPDAAKTLDTPGNSAAVLEFHSGALVTLICSAEYGGYSPELKLWGTQKALICTDPNGFGGAVKLAPPYVTPVEVPHAFGHAENSRGVGVWDMACALRDKRPHRLSANLALHALEVMLAVIDSAKTGRRIDITTPLEEMEPMPEIAATAPAGSPVAV